MNSRLGLSAACRAVGLECLCAYSHGEPRFRIRIDEFEGAPRLNVSLRNDDSITVHVLDHDRAATGILIAIEEETVQREPVLNLWLPFTARHRYLVLRQRGEWRVVPLPERVRADTVSAAAAQIEDSSYRRSA
ncbi:MAG TPA: hypothetical protein PLL30_16365 [Candidatus Krumholzibacteria bacterium]|nr:hypothetical protein [Candidatus Krumholzibacteria bacterium]HPD73346.1 hypothetical protein [Candidatus Krumholzibacteria bacterium]HRY42133.1 hypothetical protein [Candidatus Krumholzibacteria bacterium]